MVSCYEAGPFGYGRHRELTVLGVTNHVIRPRNWEDDHKRVKTDRTDALAMLTALDRFVAGNPPALALVRVPTQAGERARTESRLRQSLCKDLNASPNADAGWRSHTAAASRAAGLAPAPGRTWRCPIGSGNC